MIIKRYQNRESNGKIELLQVVFNESDLIFYSIGYPKMIYNCTFDSQNTPEWAKNLESFYNIKSSGLNEESMCKSHTKWTVSTH